MSATHVLVRAMAAVALVVAAAAPVARATSPQNATAQIATLVATDYQFTPSTLRVVAGRPLELTIVNRGHEIHGLRLVLSYGEVPFPENVPSGRTITKTFDNLGEPGTYRFYCPVDNHDQRGMHGTLIVAAEKPR